TRFGDLLRKWRMEMGMSQAELAKRVGVSNAAIASWELGRRLPEVGSRSQVIEMGDVLERGVADLNELLAAADLEPVPDRRTRPMLDRRKTFAVLRSECESYSWPTLAMNEDFEVIAWNAAANDLSELDFGVDLAEPGARQLLRMALSEHYQ